MDITKAITHVSLCAGYGGIDLGLKRAIPNLRTVAFSEIEGFACANLVAKMEAGLLDAAPIWTNLKTFPWKDFFGKVDILSGGYPCQPFSAAGKRLGTEDPRHLWPFIADGIRIMQPRVCFFENVEGHISLGLRAVIEELGSLGYKTTWGIFSAREVGAPHQRKRVFIMAHRESEGLEGFGKFESNIIRNDITKDGISGIQLADTNNSGSGQDCLLSELRTTGIEQSSGCSRISSQSTQAREIAGWPSRPSEPQHEWEPPRVVGNAGSPYAQGAIGAQLQAGTERPANPDRRTKGLRQAESPLGGDTDGPASGLDYAKLCVACDNRTDELRLLGNGVVPATATKAFLTLLHELMESK
jgi:DNA (cytosine-5)-methyltransferase 1